MSIRVIWQVTGVPLDVESKLQLQVNMGLLMSGMHLSFCDGGRVVESRTLSCTFTRVYAFLGQLHVNHGISSFAVLPNMILSILFRNSIGSR